MRRNTRGAVGQQKASPDCVGRLQKELLKIVKSPDSHCAVAPSPSTITEWHYVLIPPVDTPYEYGEYHGRIVFPANYPFAPPAIFMDTPSGRFEPGKSICFSMSEYHKDTWNPGWSVSSIVVGLLSFMLENTRTTGTIESSDKQKRELALGSRKYNKNDPLYRELFSGHKHLISERKKRKAILDAREAKAEAKVTAFQEQAPKRMKFLIIIVIVTILLCFISAVAQVSLQGKL